MKTPMRLSTVLVSLMFFMPWIPYVLAAAGHYWGPDSWSIMAPGIGFATAVSLMSGIHLWNLLDWAKLREESHANNRKNDMRFVRGRLASLIPEFQRRELSEEASVVLAQVLEFLRDVEPWNTPDQTTIDGKVQEMLHLAALARAVDRNRLMADSLVGLSAERNRVGNTVTQTPLPQSSPSSPSPSSSLGSAGISGDFSAGAAPQAPIALGLGNAPAVGSLPVAQPDQNAPSAPSAGDLQEVANEVAQLRQVTAS